MGRESREWKAVVAELSSSLVRGGGLAPRAE